ncbi:hypothetical protein TorRG33x02_138160, partial [Trema orientale]
PSLLPSRCSLLPLVDERQHTALSLTKPLRCLTADTTTWDQNAIIVGAPATTGVSPLQALTQNVLGAFLPASDFSCHIRL